MTFLLSYFSRIGVHQFHFVGKDCGLEEEEEEGGGMMSDSDS